ncbi:MAG: GyrI-like domain-containing protein [Propionicimonas sp.]
MIISAALTEPTLLTLEPEPTAVVRHTGVTVSELPALFDAGYPAVVASGARLAGPALAIYYGDPMAVFDIEIGFPVSEPLAGPIGADPAVVPANLPDGQALALSHHGSYDTLPEGWGRLAAEAEARGLTPRGCFEVYVTAPTPDTDPATLRSDLYLLVTESV